MAKIWQLMEKLPQAVIDANPNHSEVLLQLLYNRGMLETDRSRGFFY